MYPIRRKHNRLWIIRYNHQYSYSYIKDETIRIWDAHTGIQLRLIHAHSDLVRTLQFNSKIIISGSYDSSIRVWDFVTGTLILDLKGHTSRVFKIMFDETKIVSCSQDMVCFLELLYLHL